MSNATINEIMTLDLSQDIKNVIDLEDRSEQEIQQEIESYIITDGIGKHLFDFTALYTDNIKETGVWISGFYGSGKSYFAKMLGYILANPMINGTPARERFLPRVKGISNEGLIENSIRKLDSVKSRVILLDIAKQNTDNGLAFTLFTNLLKNLGFRDDLWGYMEYELFMTGNDEQFLNIVKNQEGKDWEELKKINMAVARIMRRAYLEMGYTESEYEDTKKTFEEAIKNFSAAKFRDELLKYLEKYKDETLVFVFDETSEAVSQQKFSLLDLEGISEALSSITHKVWTIAIAQEKLDDVINNSNVNRSQLTKVTDRFKTKLHLESTEVDIIIRNRLLQKKPEHYDQLKKYYLENEGLISDNTNLSSTFPTKTKDADDFATYYPFHKYQFDLLQKFLFSSNALVATQIAARGMIITTFDVLRKQMRDRELYSFTPVYAVCTEAQTAPPAQLVNKYDTAAKIIKEKNLDIDGENLLKSIHILSDSELASPTVENITKGYISDMKQYYDMKPIVQEALNLLVEAKVLLFSNHSYKITSDLESKLLEEMKDFDVPLFSKKRQLVNCLKDYRIFNSVSIFTANSDSFRFSIISDQDDDLTAAGDKQLKLRVYSLFNMGDDRQEFIDQVKMETQNQKDLITLVPDNKNFNLIDVLLGEVSRYKYIEERYANETDPQKRQIIREFSVIREEKEKNLQLKIEEAYQSGALIYLFDEHYLDAEKFKVTISDLQKKLIQNIYTKRLPAQLSEKLIEKIFSVPKDRLKNLFSGDDFNFFDSHGTFIGEHLAVVEEIRAKITSRSVDGRTLEAELGSAPWGYSFGTIAVTLAVMFRAGKLSVKYNSENWHSHTEKGVHEAFLNATRFKSASFKAITQTLTAAQKTKAVQILQDLDIDAHAGRKVDWNINDFDLADSIQILANHFIGGLNTLQETVTDFQKLFGEVADQKNCLLDFTGKVTESNYLEKVEYFLQNHEKLETSIQILLNAQKFIRKDLKQADEYKRFIKDVQLELSKAGQAEPEVNESCKEFIELYQNNLVNNFRTLGNLAQKVKDSYFEMIKTAASEMNEKYRDLLAKVDKASAEILQYPTEPNQNNKMKLDHLKQYVSARIMGEPELGFSPACKKSGYSLSDIQNFTALCPQKETELEIIKSGFIKEVPKQEAGQKPAKKMPLKVQLKVSKKVMTVKEYKNLLTSQLSSLAAANDSDEIELNVEL